MQQTPIKKQSDNIQQLYDEFKVLKNYLDSNKKIRRQVIQSNKRRYEQQNINITPAILTTPQAHKSYKNQSRSTTRKHLQESNIDLQNKSSLQQQKVYTNKQLLDQYYKHYEYSIKKVLKYKQKSGKKRVKQNEQVQDKQIEDDKRIDKSIMRRLQFNRQEQNNESKSVLRKDKQIQIKVQQIKPQQIQVQLIKHSLRIEHQQIECQMIRDKQDVNKIIRDQDQQIIDRINKVMNDCMNDCMNECINKCQYRLDISMNGLCNRVMMINNDIKNIKSRINKIKNINNVNNINKQQKQLNNNNNDNNIDIDNNINNNIDNDNKQIQNMDDFNQNQNQIDNNSIYSQTIQQSIQDI